MPDTLPDVNELFPEKPPPDVDELFPASIERERYRREQLHTSPVQDFLFSNEGPVGTVFHSAGRVLDAFGHGFTEAGPAIGMDKEDEAALKNWAGFDTWSERSKNIARAANNVLLRPAAYDFALAKHTVSGLWGGAQAAAKQFFIEQGMSDSHAGEMASFVSGEAFAGSPHFMGPSQAAISAGEMGAPGIELGVAAARRRSMEAFANRAGIQVDPTIAAAIKEYSARPLGEMGLEKVDRPFEKATNIFNSRSVYEAQRAAPLTDPRVVIRKIP